MAPVTGNTADKAAGSETIADVLAENNGIGPGFDFLRLMLSLLILFWHCFALSYGIGWSVAVMHGPWRLPIFSLVPAFFALSGFLVAGSLARTAKLSVFLLFRVLRILPALVMETLLSAFLLGTLVTTLPLKDYFTSPKFTAYMLNILGFIHYQLPGVFESNPWGGYVNFPLWTLPAELSCYILLSVLMLAGLAREKLLLLATFLIVTLIVALAGPFGFINYTSSDVIARSVLLCCFAAGNLFYQWGHRIKLHPLLFCLSLCGYAATVYWLNAFAFILGSVCITYVTVYIGMSRMPKLPLLMRGDYSYGIYLYAYPIQQAMVWLFPAHREFYFVLLTAAPLTVLFAMFSWHFVEKPTLALRKKFAARGKVVPQ